MQNWTKNINDKLFAYLDVVKAKRSVPLQRSLNIQISNEKNVVTKWSLKQK